MQNGLCEILPWDTEFFGLKIGRVKPFTLSADQSKEILAWAALEHIDCLYLLVHADDVSTIRIAENDGFQFVDVRVTLRYNLGSPPAVPAVPTGEIRTACSNDIAVLRKIAGASHTDSRFYTDLRFPRERANELYATWIEKSCSGYAQQVLVAVLNDIPVGYITCDIDNSGTGTIGLFAVDESVRGKGLGTALLSSALNWFYAQGVDNIAVVTQGRNLQAQHIYQKYGFVIRLRQRWYHWWHHL